MQELDVNIEAEVPEQQTQQTEKLFDPIYRHKDGRIVTKKQLLSEGLDDARIQKGLDNQIITQIGDTEDPAQEFQHKDGRKVSVKTLAEEGITSDRIANGIAKGLITPIEKKNQLPSTSGLQGGASVSEYGTFPIMGGRVPKDQEPIPGPIVEKPVNAADLLGLKNAQTKKDLYSKGYDVNKLTSDLQNVDTDLLQGYDAGAFTKDKLLQEYKENPQKYEDDIAYLNFVSTHRKAVAALPKEERADFSEIYLTKDKEEGKKLADKINQYGGDYKRELLNNLSKMTGDEYKFLDDELDKESTEKGSRLGYIYNSFLNGIGSVSSGASDVMMQILTTVLPEKMIGGTKEEALAQWRNEVEPITRTAMSQLVGADVGENKQKKYEKEFWTSAIGGLAGSVPMMISPYGTGLFLGSYDAGLQSINNTEEGKKLPESTKSIFAVGVGLAGAALEKVGLDKIFGKQSKRAAIGIASKTISDLLEKSTVPITKEVFEAALNANTKTIKQKIISAGGKIGKGASIEFLTGGSQEAANVAAEKLLNASQKKEVFQPQSMGEVAGRVLYAARQEGVGGGLLGGLSAFTNKTRNYISEKVAEAKTPEDIQKIKNEVIVQSQKNKIGQNESEQLIKLVDDYANINSKVPENVENRKEVINTISERDEIKTQIDAKQQELNNADDAFKPELQKELDALQGRYDELNEEAVAISKGEKPVEVAAEVKAEPQEGEQVYRVDYRDELGNPATKYFRNEEESRSFYESTPGEKEGYYDKFPRGGKIEEVTPTGAEAVPAFTREAEGQKVEGAVPTGGERVGEGAAESAPAVLEAVESGAGVLIQKQSDYVQKILGINSADADVISLIHNADLTANEKNILWRQWKRGVMSMGDIKKYTSLDLDAISQGRIDKWANAILANKKKGEKIGEDIEFEEVGEVAPKAALEVPKEAAPTPKIEGKPVEKANKKLFDLGVREGDIVEDDKGNKFKVLELFTDKYLPGQQRYKLQSEDGKIKIEGQTSVYKKSDVFKVTDIKKEEVKKIIEEFDKNDETSIQDLVNKIEEIEELPTKIQDAVNIYRQEQEYDRKLLGRGDMEAADATFEKTVRDFIQEKELPVAKPAPTPSVEVEKTPEQVTQEQLSETELLLSGEAEKRRQEGGFVKDGVEYKRNEKGGGEKGNSGEVRFTNEVSLPFKYKLIEAETLQPSHQDGIRNPLHFIPEAQPKNRNDAGSLAAEESFANNPRFDELGENTNAYSGAPVVNERNEVVQGNNRSAGLRKGYNRGNKQYREALAQNAEKFGFTKEQVEGMKNPVLVREVATSDAGAIELGNYDVKDLETGGKRRLDPVAITRRLPFNIKGRLSEIFKGDETINEALRNNTKRVFDILSPYLNQSQRNTIFKDGKLTEAGAKDMEAVVQHLLFDGGDVALPDLFENLTHIQKEGLRKALPYIFSTNQEKSIIPEIQEAILALNHFTQSRAGEFDAWLAQTDMFNESRTPKDVYSPTALEIARKLNDAKSQKEVSKIFGEYANEVNDKPATMFEEAQAGLSKAEGIKKTFKVEYDETKKPTSIKRGGGKVGGEPEAAKPKPAAKPTPEPKPAKPKAKPEPAAEAKPTEPKPEAKPISEKAQNLRNRLKLQRKDVAPTSEAPSVSPPKVYTLKNIKEIDASKYSGAAKEVVKGIANMMKAVGRITKKFTGEDVSVQIHESPESYRLAVLEAGGTEADINTKGLYIDSKNTVHLNLSEVTPDTGAHELFHPVLDYMIENNPEILQKFVDQLGELPNGQEIISKNQRTYAQDGIPTQNKEAIVDYIARVASGQIKLDKSTFQQVKDFVINALNALGINVSAKLDTVQDLQKLAQQISRQFKTGQELRGADISKKLKTENVMFSGKIDGKNVSLKNIDVEVVNGFYSPIEKNLMEYGKDKIKAKDWLNVVGKGDEAVFTGVRAFLEGKDPNSMVSKQEILDYIKDNRVSVVEVVKSTDVNVKKDKIKKEFEKQGYEISQDMSGEIEITKDEELVEDPEGELPEDLYALAQEYYNISEGTGGIDTTKFSQYQLEGEKENYKEVLVTLPSKIEKAKAIQLENGNWKIQYPDGTQSFVEYKSKAFAEKDIQRGVKSKGEIKKAGDFRSTHFDEPNILVHLRMNTRTDAEGKKVLFLEEIQSDWGQKGKREGFDFDKKSEKELGDEKIQLENERNSLRDSNEYRKLQNQYLDPIAKEKYDKPYSRLTNNEQMEVDFELYQKDKPLLNKIEKAQNTLINDLNNIDNKIANIENRIDKLKDKVSVPSAPFVMDTNAWTKLGLKVALKEAVKQGADKIAWTTGEQQNERYDLSKQVDEIRYSKNSDGTYSIIANKNGNDVIHESSLKEKDLEASFGKDVAQRIINNEGDKSGLYKSLKGENLSVGGKGMKGFYGSMEEGAKGIVGGVAEKVFGQKVGETKIETASMMNFEIAKSTEDVKRLSKSGSYTFMENGNPISKSRAYELIENGESVEARFTGKTTQPSIDITPELKIQVEKGLPQFSRKNIEEELKKYIEEERASGVPESEIKATILEANTGLSEARIDEVLAEKKTTSIKPIEKAEELGYGLEDIMGEPQEAIYVEPKRTIFSHRGLQEVATEFGLDDVGPRERKRDATLFQEVDDILTDWQEKGTYNKNIEKLFEKAKNKLPFGEQENLIMAQHIAQLREQGARIRKEYGINSPEYNKKLKEINEAIRLAESVRSQQGAALRVPIFARTYSATLEDAMTTKMEALGVDELLPEQKAEVEKLYNEIEKTRNEFNQYRAEAEKKFADMQAEIELNKLKSEKAKAKKPSKNYAEDRKSYIQQLKSAVEEYKAAGRKMGIAADGGVESFVISAKIAKIILKIVGTHVGETGAKLNEVVDKTLNDVKDIFTGITDRDIRDIIAGKYAEKKETYTDLMADMRNLKSEQVLLDEYNNLMKGGTPTDVKKAVRRNQRLAELRQQIDAIKKEKRLGRFSEEEMADKIIEANKKRIEEINKKIANKDFEKTQKPKTFWESQEFKQKNPELYRKILDSYAKKEAAQVDFDISVLKDQESKKTKFEKATDWLGALANTTKKIVTGIDDSSLFMQTLSAFFSRPRIGTKAFKEHILDAMSKQRYERKLSELHNSADWELIKQSGLDVTEPTSLSQEKREEAFSGKTLDIKIKAGGKEYKILNEFTAPFERAFTSLGNNMRILAFRMYVDELKKEGYTFEKNPQKFKDLALMLNTETGRGKQNVYIEKASNLVTKGIWSPRLMASRLNMLGISDLVSLIPGIGTKGFYRQLDPQIRKLAIRDTLTFTTSILVTSYLLAYAFGGEVDDDPTSSTYLDIKMPDGKSYNISGGFAQYIRLLAQTIRGGKTKGGVFEEFKGQKDRGSNALRFLRGKLTPVAGAGVDLLTGKDFMGKPVTLLGEVKKLTIPLSLQGVADAIQEDGLSSLYKSTLPSFVGISVKDEKNYPRPAVGLKTKGLKWLEENKIDLPRYPNTSKIKVNQDENHPEGLMTEKEQEKFKEIWEKEVASNLDELYEKSQKKNITYSEDELKDVRSRAAEAATKTTHEKMANYYKRDKINETGFKIKVVSENKELGNRDIEIYMGDKKVGEKKGTTQSDQTILKNFITTRKAQFPKLEKEKVEPIEETE